MVVVVDVEVVEAIVVDVEVVEAIVVEVVVEEEAELEARNADPLTDARGAQGARLRRKIPRGCGRMEKNR